MKGLWWRRILAGVLLLPALSSCTTPSQTPTGKPVDYAAIEAALKDSIAAGSPLLDNVRAVLIDVDGEPKVTLYRHGFTAADYEHPFSVTKSVLSMLIGTAISEVRSRWA